MQCVCKCGSSARDVSWVNKRGGEIASQPVGLRATNPDAGRCKRLKFRKADRTARACASRIRSSLPRNPAMETDFGGEKVKSKKIRRLAVLLATFSPRGVQPLCQRLAREAGC